MSQKDLEAAITAANTRLKQAKETINWARSILNDPASNLSNYHLTPDETNKLKKEMKSHLEEVHILSVLPPIPPWDAQPPHTAVEPGNQPKP